MIWCRDNLAPRTAGPETLVSTIPTLYAGGFNIINEMVNQVIVTGRDPEKAWAEARKRYEKRLEEGKKKYG